MIFYNYYRDYDPTVGRYLQPDPIRLAGGVNPDVNPLQFTNLLEPICRNDRRVYRRVNCRASIRTFCDQSEALTISRADPR